MITLLLLTLLSTEPEIITCTVTAPATVQCPVRNPVPECVGSNHRHCRNVTIAKIQWDNEVFSEWLLVADNWNFPLRKVTPVVGQKLRVTRNEGGHFIPVASCEVRVHRRVSERSLAHPGERVPFTVMEPPADCQPAKELKRPEAR